MKQASANLISFLRTSSQFLYADLFTITLQPTGTQVNLSSFFNINSAIANDNSTFSSSAGADGVGSAYSEQLLGPSLLLNEVLFNFGSPNAADAVTNTTVTLPSGSFSSLQILATGVNGNQPNQLFQVNYADGSSQQFTQSLSDWFTPQYFSGEVVAKFTAYRNLSTGVRDSRTFSLYTYSFPLNSSKVVSNIILPSNNGVVVLAMTLVGNSGGSGSQVFFYTNSDRDLLFNGNKYVSGTPLFERGSIKWQTGLAVDTLELTVKSLVSDTVLGAALLQDLIVGKFDNAQVSVDRLYMQFPGDTSLGTVNLFKGNIGSISELGRTSAKIEVKSKLQKLNIQMPLHVYQPNCRWTLYDPGCGLVKANFGVNGVVQAGSNAITLITNLTAQIDTYFNQGTITFTSGQNNGLTRSVRSFLDAQFTRIQTTGGSNVLKYYFDIGLSVNGVTYRVSVLVKNQGAAAISIGSNVGGSVTVPAGTTQQVSFTVVGDGVSNVQLRFQANASTDSLDVVAVNPFLGKVSDGINLIPQANLQFVGWNAFGGAGITLTQDYLTGIGKLLSMYLALPFTPAAGDTFTAFPGCAKTISACVAFNNIQNFSGEPFVPIPETGV